MSEIARSAAAVAKKIDHTLLRPEAIPADYSVLCEEAIKWGFYSVCIPSSYIGLARQELGTSGVKICSVVGFPLGNSLSAVKATETAMAVELGADEIDMVIAIGALKAGDHALVVSDIQQVVAAAAGRPVKVIVETHFLSEAEKLLAADSILAAGAQFIKTSTGFTGGGATAEDIRLFRRHVGSALSIKASGGIRDGTTAQLMLAAGADRLGASSSVAIVTGASGGGGY